MLESASEAQHFISFYQGRIQLDILLSIKKKGGLTEA